ncbi:MAG TPA: M48 family metallopeptidase [Bacteroidales bacterium]|nr:M48 family metallopeptidase [Bacteroidales bacterium]
MIRKAIIQGLITASVFIVVWFAIGQVNWLGVLKIEKTKNNLEEKLGRIFYDLFRNSEEEIDNINIKNTLDSLFSVISTKNGIENDIKIHILRSDEINAFALPDRHMIINTGLIEASGNQQELCGVICHELAHIESGHVMKKLIKEMGLNVLVSMTSGGGTETIKKAAGILSSTAYDRSLEEEADRIAVDYLINAGIDAKPFASFLYTALNTRNQAAALSWISTHPDAEERAMDILEYCSNQSSETILPVSEATWQALKTDISR